MGKRKPLTAIVWGDWNGEYIKILSLDELGNVTYFVPDEVRIAIAQKNADHAAKLLSQP